MACVRLTDLLSRVPGACFCWLRRCFLPSLNRRSLYLISRVIRDKFTSSKSSVLSIMSFSYWMVSCLKQFFDQIRYFQTNSFFYFTSPDWHLLLFFTNQNQHFCQGFIKWNEITNKRSYERWRYSICDRQPDSSQKSHLIFLPWFFFSFSSFAFLVVSSGLVAEVMVTPLWLSAVVAMKSLESCMPLELYWLVWQP